MIVYHLHAAQTVKTLSKAAKIGIGVGVAIFGISLLVIGFYAIKQRKRAQKAEKLNKPFGKPMMWS